MRRFARITGILSILVAGMLSGQAGAPLAPTFRDVPYASGHAAQRLDVYLPRSAAPTPAVVFIHGGGWRGGSKNRIPGFLAAAVKEGWLAVVSVEYRFSDVAIHPAQVNDCMRAIQYVRTKAKEWNIDASRLGVTGGSAGGHLSLWVALHDDTANPAAADPVEKESSRVACVVSFAGPTDWGLLAALAHKHPAYRQLLGYVPATPAAEMAEDLKTSVSPISYVSPDDPPVLQVHGSADDIVPIQHARNLDARLRAARVESELYVVEGANHGVAGAADPGGASRATAFFRQHLRVAPPAAPAPSPAAAQEGYRTLKSWEFNGQDAEGWTPARHLASITLADGAVSGRATGQDPQLVSPLFELPASPFQEVWARVKSDRAGRGELFYTNTTEGQYGGFSGTKVAFYTVTAADTWEVVRMRPFWQTEKRLIHLRFDPLPDSAMAVDWIRIVEPVDIGSPVAESAWGEGANGLPSGWRQGGPNRWTAPLLNTPVDDLPLLVLDLQVPAEGLLNVRWASDSAQGLQHLWQFLGRDGLRHRLQIDMASREGWSGRLLMLEVQVTTPEGASAALRAASLQAKPEPAADVHVLSFAQQDGINRVGRPAVFLLRLLNRGGARAEGVRVAAAAPPELGSAAVPAEAAAGLTLEPEEPRGIAITVTPTAAGKYALSADVGVAGVGRVVSTPMEVLPALPPAPTGSIPEPRPAQTPYLIGSYYYPGFGTERQWRELERAAPWAKPVLGYYDEGKAECVDWQIKWAVEHGVGFFLVDWYWVAGSRSHLHWLEAFEKARFRKYMKWAVMWANHNPPKTHSEADWRAVTQYWLEHYFGMPEYLRYDGKPVVALWSSANLRRDLGGSEEARRMLDLSQEMARAAGFPGIYFVAMNQSPDPALRAEGYAAATSYHWWSDSRGRSADPHYWSYETVVERARPAWDADAALAKTHGLSFWPVADTGWDARPRHGDNTFVIYRRTSELFRRHLEDAKAWLDAHGQRLLVLGPWNEWTEGSYIEPCAEWGFDMLRALHGTFCAGQPPTPVGPRDVGLGPYDFDLSNPQARCRDWQFTEAGNLQGWRDLMGLQGLQATAEGLTSITTGRDPALVSPAIEAKADSVTAVEVTMALNPAPAGDKLVLFWATRTAPWNGRACVAVPLAADSAPHTYTLAVGEHRAWRGVITQLRVDPCGVTDTTVRVTRVRLLP